MFSRSLVGSLVMVLSLNSFADSYITDAFIYESGNVEKAYHQALKEASVDQKKIEQVFIKGALEDDQDLGSYEEEVKFAQEEAQEAVKANQESKKLLKTYKSSLEQATKIATSTNSTNKLVNKLIMGKAGKEIVEARRALVKLVEESPNTISGATKKSLVKSLNVYIKTLNEVIDALKIKVSKVAEYHPEADFFSGTSIEEEASSVAIDGSSRSVVKESEAPSSSSSSSSSVVGGSI